MSTLSLRGLLAALPFALLGCASGVDDDLSKDAYTTDFVQASCDFYERCDLLRELRYESLEHCIEENTATIQEQLDDDATCGSYDGSAAMECVAGIESLACEERYSGWPDACGDICGYGR